MKEFTASEMEEIQKSFDRTDKIVAFKKELTNLINRHSIDNLFEVPDYMLANVAVAQMEVCSSIVSGIKGEKFKPVLMM